MNGSEKEKKASLWLQYFPFQWKQENNGGVRAIGGLCVVVDIRMSSISLCNAVSGKFYRDYVQGMTSFIEISKAQQNTFSTRLAFLKFLSKIFSKVLRSEYCKAHSHNLL